MKTTLKKLIRPLGTFVILMGLAALTGFGLRLAFGPLEFKSPVAAEASGTVLRIDRKDTVSNRGLFGVKNTTQYLILLEDGRKFTKWGDNDQIRLTKEGDEVYIKTNTYDHKLVDEFVNLTLNPADRTSLPSVPQ